MISICFVGDIVPGGSLVYRGGVSKEIKEYLSQFDLRVANLESPLCDGTTKCHIKMADPLLGNIIFSPEEMVRVLLDLKIDVVSLANNHICDCDLPGLHNTIKVLNENGIAHFGAGRNEEETKLPAIVKLNNGKTACFLGYYHADWEAQYPSKGDVGGINQLIIEDVVKDIIYYKKSNDYVFVCPHWGKEHTIYPLICDVRYLQMMISAGATAIMGSHTHIPQSHFVARGTAVCMSLGNFLFPERYIIPPRQTYYPTLEERSRPDIPVTYKFPIVNELTYKKLPMSARIGLICVVKICPYNKVFLDSKYTILDNEDLLSSYNISILFKMKLFIVSLLLRDKNTKVYYLFCNVLNRICSLFRLKYRFGFF